MVLADTIRMLRKLQEHVRACPAGAAAAHAVPPPPPMAPPPPSRAASLPSPASPSPAAAAALAPPHEPPPGTARSQVPPLAAPAPGGGVSSAGQLSLAGSAGGALEMPLPLDIPASATGVMVEASPGSATWRLRVTCRDRPGLLADVAVALRALPVSVAHASVTTTPEGKAQQVRSDGARRRTTHDSGRAARFASSLLGGVGSAPGEGRGGRGRLR